MTSVLRLKVQIGDDKGISFGGDSAAKPSKKFLYSLDLTSTVTIENLIEKLQKYMMDQFSFSKTSIVELMTFDGFILRKSDLCTNILKDNDHIICVDMPKFIENYHSTFKGQQVWLELQQHDASDNRQKSIRIGINHFSQLFIHASGTSNIASLHIFTTQDLARIVREKQAETLITRLDHTQDYYPISSHEWFIESRWAYDMKSDKNLFIVSTLKVASEMHTYCAKLQIILDEERCNLERGDIEQVMCTNEQAESPIEQQQRLQVLASKVSGTKRTGREIIPDERKDLKITKHECEGDSLIRMTYGSSNRIAVYQDLVTAHESSFFQVFTITHVIFSKKPLILPEILHQKRSTPTEKPISIAHLTVMCQNHDNGWYDCQDIAVAPIITQNDELKWLNDPIINIEPDKLISFAIRGKLLVKGEPSKNGAVQERLHKSLPQPFRLKIVITDNFGKQCSLIVEQLNPPLELNTSENFLKQNRGTVTELLSYLYADDCYTDERICMAMFISTEGRLVIKKYDLSYATFDRKSIRMLEFKAKQARTNEVLLKNTLYQHYHQQSKATAILDPETYLLYAIRLEVSTKTSQAEETVYIPMEKIK